MNQKPTYEELEQRVLNLENVEFERKKALEEESKKIGNKITESIDGHGFLIATHYRKKSGQVFPGEESVHSLYREITWIHSKGGF